jgi:transposase
MAGIRHHAPARDAVSWHSTKQEHCKLAAWLKDAQQSGLYAMQRFARTLRRDIDAVRNAITEHWSNGQTEGQINRLKTLKRAMYGRAGPELLHARLLPL